MGDLDSAKIARIDERTLNMKSWAEAHDKHDDERFDRTFKFMKDSFDKIDTHFENIEEKLDTLWDTKNKQDGAFSAGKIGYGGIVMLIGAVAGYFGGHK